MKKRSGFTLIELLAVIVILAIIALIAVPVIMNILNKANKSALKDTAYGVISAGELYFAEQQLDLNGMKEEKTFTFPTTEIEVKGNVPEGTVLKVNTEGKIALTMSNGRYCITKGYTDNDIVISEDLTACGVSGGENGTGGTDDDSNPSGINYTALAEVAVADLGLEKPACVTNGTCEAGTPIAIQVNDTTTEKFYVLNDNGNTITLLLNRNLYPEGNTTNPNIEWINYEDYKAIGEKLTVDGQNWEWCGGHNFYGPITALRALKERTSTWTNIEEYSYELDYAVETYSGEYVQDVRTRLPKLSDWTEIIACTPNGCPEWLYENTVAGGGDTNTYGYWLSDAVDVTGGGAEGFVYMVGIGHVDAPGYPLSIVISEGSSYGVGVRPVITLTK